jgi:hypothetical protein
MFGGNSPPSFRFRGDFMGVLKAFLKPGNNSVAPPATRIGGRMELHASHHHPTDIQRANAEQ